MKVLVLSPEKKDKESRKRRRLVVRALEDFKVKLLNPIPGRPPEKKTSRLSLFPQIFYIKQVDLIKGADLIIADLTDPDFKIGFLISKALELKKPVLGLFWESIVKEKIKDWQENDLLFVECFNKENVRSVLRYFLKFIRQRKKLRGKLVVIDGIDGSGKATQLKLLLNYLKKRGIKTKHIDFPRYKSSFHGQMVGRYLSGEFGSLNDVNPYYASLFYALDRLAAKPEIEDWLRVGYTVVSNRYASSSMTFQVARTKPKEREEFLNWLINMEYKVHKLPKEDILIFLHVPSEIGRKLVLEKKEKRAYLNGKKYELYEANLKLLKKAEKLYLDLTKRFNHWVKIDCLDKKGKLLSPEAIHEKVVNILKKRGIINE